jgi:large subunit ribosomal protein L25
MQLVKGRRISVNVPVHVTGREACAGVKQGGVVDHILREIPLEVLPGQIPDSIEIDISTLGLGAHVFVRDLPIPEGATLLLDEGEIAVSVIIPRGVIEAEAAEEEKEVEVLAKGKAKAEKEE